MHSNLQAGEWTSDFLLQFLNPDIVYDFYQMLGICLCFVLQAKTLEDLPHLLEPIRMLMNLE